MFNKSSFYTIRTIGLMICYFILSFSFIRSQSITHKISDNYKLVSSLTDSMNQYTQWYFNGKIDTILFLTQKENFNNQIFNLIVANSDLMYQLIDSINQDNYPKPIEELMDTTLIIESDYPTQESTGSEIMDTLSDSSFQTPYPEIPQRSRTFSPMNIAGKVMTMNSGKRTTFHIQFGLYFNNWIESNPNPTTTPIKLNMWKSFNFFGDISLIWKTRLGKSNSPIGIYYGIGVDNRQFTMKNNFRDILQTSAIVDINIEDTPFVGPKIRFDITQVPDFTSDTAFPISIVTVPDFGFGIKPLGPKTLPNGPNFPITAGIVTIT